MIIKQMNLELEKYIKLAYRKNYKSIQKIY